MQNKQISNFSYKKNAFKIFYKYTKQIQHFVFLFYSICRQKVHQAGSHYCQACAYKKAICAMCGKKLMSTKNYKQSST